MCSRKSHGLIQLTGFAFLLKASEGSSLSSYAYHCLNSFSHSVNLLNSIEKLLPPEFNIIQSTDTHKTFPPYVTTQ